MMFIRFLLLFFCLCDVGIAQKVVIRQGKIAKHDIAIAAFASKSKKNSKLGQIIKDIISNDLKNSGLFMPIEDSQCNNKAFFIFGKINDKARGHKEINFELFEAFSGNKMLTANVVGHPINVRRVAHQIADLIYKRITSQYGYFNTQIVYVETANSKNFKKRQTRLIQVDQDGYNRKILTEAAGLNLTPRYSSNGEIIAYIAYSDHGRGAIEKSANVYILDLRSGKTTRMISNSLMTQLIKKNKGFPVQMTYAPRFSPDDKNAALAIIIDGKSAIYSINFESNALVQLTFHNKIDTSPCYSADGKKIVFTSNRTGKEAIFVMNTNGSGQKKISQQGGKYSQPVWSPRGDLIAFSKQIAGNFYIGVMDVDGNNERLIARGYLVESPCWASNGQYITYTIKSSASSDSKIGIVDITGQNNILLDIKNDGSYPTWSPVKVYER